MWYHDDMSDNDRKNPFLDNKDDAVSPEIRHVLSHDHDGTKSDSEWESIMNGAIDDDEKTSKRIIMRSRWRRVMDVILSILLVIIVIIGIFMGIRYISLAMRKSSPEPTSSSTATTSGSSSSDSKYTDTIGDVNPSSSLTFSSESMSTDAASSKNTVTLKNINGRTTTVTIDNLTSDISSQSCTMKDVASTCYMGTAKYKNWSMDLFSFRDASTTSLLLTSKSTIRETTIKNTRLSYLTKMTDSTGKGQVNALVIVLNDQTGVIMASSNSLDSFKNGIMVKVNKERA